MNRRRLAWCAAVSTTALALTGCGAGTTTNVPQTTLSQLRHDVLMLSRAAAAHDNASAASALDTLNVDLAAARAAGTLTEARVAEIGSAADAVRGDLEVPLLTPSTSPASTTQAPRPTKTKHHGNGGGHSQGG